MEILWHLGEGTVQDILDNLPKKRDLAYTSVSTILRILEQKKILTTKKSGRKHIYKPVLSKRVFAQYSVEKLVQQVFSGDSLELVSHLLDKKSISIEVIKKIQKLLNKKKRVLHDD
jgi:predicted transcriptional regulator